MGLDPNSDEVYEFIVNCIDEDAPFACYYSFYADVKTSSYYSYIDILCSISYNPSPANFFYKINLDIEGNHNELNKHEFWSNGTYCKMKYLPTKHCLKITRRKKESALYIYFKGLQ